MLAVCWFVYMTTSVFVENRHVQNLGKYKKNNFVNKIYLSTLIKQYMGNKIGWCLWCILSYFFQKDPKSVTYQRGRENYIFTLRKRARRRRKTEADDSWRQMTTKASSFLNLSNIRIINSYHKTHKLINS
jgi:hypothetical protein